MHRHQTERDCYIPFSKIAAKRVFFSLRILHCLCILFLFFLFFYFKVPFQPKEAGYLYQWISSGGRTLCSPGNDELLVILIIEYKRNSVIL